MIGLIAVLLWSAYLYTVAVRQNYSFTDVQAVLAILLPLAILAVSGGLVVLLGTCGILLT